MDGEVRQLGLDIGATNIKLAVVEDDGVVATDQAPTRSEKGGPPAVLERAIELGRSAGPVESVGVAVPGLFDADGVALLLPNLYGEWTGQPLREPLERAFGREVPLVNDGHAFALAEARVGAARGSRDVICIVCGTGIGGGLVIDGEIHLGTDDRAGEVGHHTVVLDGPACECGNRGCLETLAGARAIARAAGKASFDEVVPSARAGDQRAREALADAGRLIGTVVANLTIFVAPQRVVVGGGVAEAGDLLLEPLRETVVQRAANVAPLEKIGIVRASLGSYAGAIGAALYGGGGVSRRP
jgi:glucokinase